MNSEQFATVAFCLNWKSGRATHADRLVVPGADLRHDDFPGLLQQKLQQLEPGGSVSELFSAGELVEPWKPSDVRRIPVSEFNRDFNNLDLVPQRGRFYPKAVIAGVDGCLPGDIRPFRVIDVEDGSLGVDLNHPLATYPLAIEAKLLQRIEGREPPPGANGRDLTELLTGRGPGLQARNGLGLALEFPLKRADENEDSRFYAMPRMVGHIDEKAAETLRSIYRRYLEPGKRVLDLMTSWTSHIDGSIADLSVAGVGMNREEMEANTLLSERVLQDLNREPALPFEDASFDIVLCSLSVEYLVSPLDLFREVRRVLKPGGLFINSFSERWFPAKAVTLWTELHPFERVGMVLDHYIATGFEKLGTESVRGQLRPGKDSYRELSPFSDPLYIVTGARLSE